jgi:hypothetical protein
MNGKATYEVETGASSKVFHDDPELVASDERCIVPCYTKKSRSFVRWLKAENGAKGEGSKAVRTTLNRIERDERSPAESR